MTAGASRREKLTLLFVGLWGLAFAGAFLAYAVTPLERDLGFALGAAKMVNFIYTQILAAALSLVAWTLAHPLAPGLARRLGQVPIWVTFCILVILAGLSIFGMLL